MDFLSPEWFDQLELTLAAITVGEQGDKGLSLGQVITETPLGTVNYTIHLGGGRPGSLVRDSVDSAQITLVENFASAQSIIAGESVTELLAASKIKIRGDVNALLGASVELGALADAISKVS